MTGVSSYVEVFNLSNCQQISWLDLIDWLKNFGYDIDILPYDTWKSALVTINPDNALFPLLSLYIEDEMVVVKIKENITDTRNTFDTLTAAGINMPSIDDRILHKTFNYLSEVFFTKKKEFSNEK